MLDLNQDGTAGDKLTFFQGTPDATDVTFAGDFTRVAGTLNLTVSDVLEANAHFEMISQAVDVGFGNTPGTVDLHQAQLLLLNFSCSTRTTSVQIATARSEAWSLACRAALVSASTAVSSPTPW